MSFKIVVHDNQEPNKVIVQDNIVQVIVQSTDDTSNVYVNQPSGIGPGGERGPTGPMGHFGSIPYVSNGAPDFENDAGGYILLDTGLLGATLAMGLEDATGKEHDFITRANSSFIVRVDNEDNSNTDVTPIVYKVSNPIINPNQAGILSFENVEYLNGPVPIGAEWTGANVRVGFVYYGVTGATGATGENGVISWNGLTGDIVTTTLGVTFDELLIKGAITADQVIISDAGLSVSGSATIGEYLTVADDLFVGGISADGGATFGEDVNILGGLSCDSGATFGGNISLPRNKWIGIDDGDERIFFAGGANEIRMITDNVVIENKLSHLSDDDTYLSFTDDNIELAAGDAAGSIHLLAGLSADKGATFGGQVNFIGGISCGGATFCGDVGITCDGMIIFTDGSTMDTGTVRGSVGTVRFYYWYEPPGSESVEQPASGCISSSLINASKISWDENGAAEDVIILSTCDMIQYWVDNCATNHSTSGDGIFDTLGPNGIVRVSKAQDTNVFVEYTYDAFWQHDDNDGGLCPVYQFDCTSFNAGLASWHTVHGFESGFAVYVDITPTAHGGFKVPIPTNDGSTKILRLDGANGLTAGGRYTLGANIVHMDDVDSESYQSRAKDATLVYDGGTWVTSTPNEARLALGMGPGGTLGNSGDLLRVVAGGTTLEYVRGFVGASGAIQGIFAVPGLSCDAGATFGSDINVNDLTIGHGSGGITTNTALGYHALNSNTSGYGNVSTGYQSLYSNAGGYKNTASGYRSLYSNTEGNNNVASGNASLYNNTDGDNNVALGYASLYSNTDGYRNVAIGTNSLYSNIDGSYNTASGYKSLFNNTTGWNNTATGYQSLYSNSIGMRNVATGIDSLYNNTEGWYNVATGYKALYNNIDGENNIASGYASLFHNIDGNYNIATGRYSLYTNTEGYTNIATGYKSLYKNTVGYHNVAFGEHSLYYNIDGDYNIAIGSYSLWNNIDGNKNSALGYYAGKDGTTGSNNTYLGHMAQPSYATASNEIVLGDANVTLIHSVAGMSLDGGATFGGKVTITGTGDANLWLIADTDDSGETETPLILMTSDGGNHSANIGLVGVAGTYFTGSIADAMFFEGMGAKDIQFANDELARYTIHAGGINHFHSGISADLGATFGKDVNFLGQSKYTDGKGIVNTNDDELAIKFENDSKITIGDCNDAANETKLVIDDGNQMIELIAEDADIVINNPIITSNVITISDGGGGSRVDLEQAYFGYGVTFGASFNLDGGSGEHFGLIGSTGATGTYLQFADGTTQQTAYTEEIIGISVDNGTEVLTTGVKGHRTLPYKCEVVDWRVLSTQGGDCIWAINFSNFDNYPGMTGIDFGHHSEIPQIGPIGPEYIAESWLSPSAEWDIYKFNKGDILQFEIEGTPTVTDCSLELTIRKIP